MQKVMVINALHQEECRVAIVENGKLFDLEVETTEERSLRGNIYKAKISRIEPSLQAAFIDIGSSRNGFLQINDINQGYFKNWPPLRRGEGGRGEDNSASEVPNLLNVLSKDQEIVVQVVKDERDAKGATLTTNLSIPGRYLVLMIGTGRGGVSRKINDEKQRRRLKKVISNLQIPPGMNVIVRTAGLNRSAEELEIDLRNLLDIWHGIVESSHSREYPNLLYHEQDLASRAMRDYLRSNFDAVHVDNPALHEKIKESARRTLPSMVDKIHLYQGSEPVFSKFGIEKQVVATYQNEVTLPSGGSIVISPTEAIVAIDVNSGRSTGQSDVEETAFNTNLEAAQEIATQLRLRDLGGLIVIDFIDMWERKHRLAVEKRLKSMIRSDRAKTEIGRISRFGLLEMSRQRLKTSLTSRNHSQCPYCQGKGSVRTPDSIALEALRKIEAAIIMGGVKVAKVHISPSAALFLLNEKRSSLYELEKNGASVKVYADGRLKPDEYKLILETSSAEGAEESSSESASESGSSRPRRRSGSSRSGARSSGSARRRSGRDRRRRGRSGDEGSTAEGSDKSGPSGSRREPSSSESKDSRSKDSESKNSDTKSTDSKEKVGRRSGDLEQETPPPPSPAT